VIEKIFEGELPMVVGYTGIKADTPTIVRQVAELRRQEKWVDAVMGDIDDLVKQAKIMFKNKEIEQLGKLMNRNQELLQTLNVSSKELDNLIRAARKAGAYGAKLSGAGGGDCMMALVGSKQKEQVVEKIKRAGGVYMDVKTGAEGVRRERR